jgi:hypothetical protein
MKTGDGMVSTDSSANHLGCGTLGFVASGATLICTPGCGWFRAKVIGITKMP